MNGFEVFRVFLMQFIGFLLLASFMGLYEGTQGADFLVHLTLKIKLIRFRQPKLTVVIIQALLGDAYDLSSLLQVDFLLFVIGFGAGLMQIPPSLHKLQYLSYSPLFASLLLLLPTIEFKHRRVAILLSCKLFPTTVPNQNKLRLEHTPPKPSIPRLYFFYIDKLIVIMLVNGDPMVLGVTVLGKYVVEVDILSIEVQLLLKNEGLMGILTLQDEGFL